jgi:hypothetical protein
VTPALRAALDILDALTDEEIAPMRAAISRAIATARRRGGVATAEPAVAAWPPIEREMVWVLWLTSSDVLDQQM